MTKICLECHITKLNPSDRLSQMRGVCEFCWEELPWQERLTKAALSISMLANNPDSPWRVSVWRSPFKQLSDEFLEAAGPWPPDKLDDVIRYVRSVTEPLGHREGYEWSVLGEGFAVLYPKGWRVERKFTSSSWSHRFVAPSNVAGKPVIEVKTIPKRWEAAIPSNAQLQESLEACLKSRKCEKMSPPRFIHLDGYGAVQVDWLSREGFLKKRLIARTTTYTITHDRELFIEGTIHAEYQQYLQPPYFTAVESFRISPLPDEEYTEWLQASGNRLRGFMAMLKHCEEGWPTSADALRRRARQKGHEAELTWKLLFKHGLNYNFEDEELNSLVTTEVDRDIRFWALVWVLADVASDAVGPGPTAPLMRNLPEFFEAWAQTVWEAVILLCHSRTREKAAELLDVLMDDPASLHADIGFHPLSQSSVETIALLCTIPRKALREDIAELGTSPIGGLALRMRIYRAAEHFAFKGKVRSLRSDRPYWQSIFKNLGYEGKELEQLVNAILAQDYILEDHAKAKA
ncbi:MAG: hypothetical protein U9R11_03280 [Chloroflexota bacterium]|nr:hypothetical protein [Chloroflexota bacterium]